MEIWEEVNSPLFSGIRRDDLRSILSCTGYRVRSYERGEILSLEGELIRHIGILLKGSVDMNKEDVWGEKTLLSRMEKGEIFGESFACGADQTSVVTFCAHTDCRVLFIPFTKVMNSCSNACAFHQVLILNVVREIARKNRDLMLKLELLSKKSLREKLMAYLSAQAQKQGTRYFECPLGRVALAEYLCADRSALSRELAHMKADGLIDYDRNRFRIL